MVPYAHFAARMSQTRYRRLLLLACMDLLSELPEEEKRKRLGDNPETARTSELGTEIRERVRAVAVQLAEERDMARTAADFETLFAREKMRQALTGSADTRGDAVDAFLDRRSARKGKEDGSSGLALPAALIEALRVGFQLGSGAADETVSASRLNTPKLVGSGGA